MAVIRPVPSDWDAQLDRMLAAAEAPWWSGFEGAIAALAHAPRPIDVGVIDRLFHAAAGVRFEPQTEARRRGTPFSPQASYDGSITTRHVVPTREGSMHDLTNALVWSVYPQTKRAIHARQLDALRREVDEGVTALPGRRSRLRDRLSMLDEGGVIVTTNGEPALAQALADSDHDALREARARGALEAHVLGHALLEHAAARDPRTLRGCVVQLPPSPECSLDTRIAQALCADDDALEQWIARLPSIALEALFAPHPA